MNYKKLQEAKHWYEQAKSLSKTLDDKGWIDRGDYALDEILEYDVLNYIMFLIAADGKITGDEVDVYRFVTGYGGDDLDSIKKNIEESDVMTYDFQSEPPLSLKMLIRGVNQYLLHNPGAEETVAMTLEQYLLVFLTVGKEVIRADDSVTYAENRDYQTYISTIKQYIEEHAYVSLKGTLASLLDGINDFLLD